MRVREKVRLGMTEQEVVKAFPDGDGFTRRKVPGGLGLVINVIPEKSPGYIPREVFVRFGPEKVVAEVRVRYTSQPGIKGGVNNLLQEIGASCGAAHELGGSWTRVWSEYPQRTPAPRMYRWEDDVTIMTCQRDSEGVELTLLDRPLDFEKGVKLGAFQCLSEGPRNCTLGMTKAELVELWKDSKPTFEDNVLIVTAPVESSYSQIQAFFKDSTGLVTRVVALHAQKWDKDPGQEKLEEAVQGAWERGKESLGFYRRMDLTMNDTVQSLTSHDDVRRVCVFWQETKAGPRLYTEWTRIEKAQK
jgi:hypothetical protein